MFFVLYLKLNKLPAKQVFFITTRLPLETRSSKPARNPLNPAQRYRLIDRGRLMNLLGVSDSQRLDSSYRHWVEDLLSKGVGVQDRKWTKSIAVGGKTFVERTKEKPAIRGVGRKIAGRVWVKGVAIFLWVEFWHPKEPFNHRQQPALGCILIKFSFLIWSDPD